MFVCFLNYAVFWSQSGFKAILESNPSMSDCLNITTIWMTGLKKVSLDLIWFISCHVHLATFPSPQLKKNNQPP